MVARERWLEYMGRPELETWLAYIDGTPAGYYEQDLQAEGNAEIVNFGILPDFVGQGVGGHLLTHAVEHADGSAARDGCGCTPARSIIRAPAPLSGAALPALRPEDDHARG